MTASVSVDSLKGAKEEIKKIISSNSCGPILIRLAWHDAGTYDASIGADKWPSCGGANGSIRFDPEMGHGANAGLTNAVVLLEPVKAQYTDIGYADLFQLASATAVEVMGGPVIPMKYGRKDATGPEMCHPEGNLPAGNPPFPKDADAATHLRDVFHRMGLTDQHIVALSGAHTVGRAHASRSGEGKEQTKYTAPECCPVGTKCTGGSSWTPDWVKFDNSYWTMVKGQSDANLLVLETDAVLFKDESFKVFAEKYAADQDTFFADYALSHAKLSELGVQWDGEPVTI